MAVESADKSQKYGSDVSALFASCMDLVAINNTNSQPLLDLINKGDALQFPTLVVSLMLSCDLLSMEFEICNSLFVPNC